MNAEAPDLWFPEELVVVLPATPGESQEVALRGWPALTVTARIEVPPSEGLPDEVDVHLRVPEALPFAPEPKRAGQDGERSPATALLRCPVEADPAAASGAAASGLIRCTAPAGRFDLRLGSEGLVPIYRWGVGLAAGEVADLGEFALQPGASLSGRVVIAQPEATGAAAQAETETGPSPEQVELTLVQAGAERAFATETGRRLTAAAPRAQADERGFFQLAGLAPGRYDLTAQAPGLAPRSVPVEIREGLEAQLKEPLVLAPPAPVEIALMPPRDPWGLPWSVHLNRIDPDLSFPLERLEAQEIEGADGESAATWSVAGGVAPGLYRIEVEDRKGSLRILREVEVGVAGESLVVEMPVIAVSGRVVRGNEGVEGVLQLISRHEVVDFDLDEAGRLFGFLPGEGRYEVELEEAGEEGAVRLEPVEIVVGEELLIELADTLLAGEVVDEEGEPVAGAFVSATRVPAPADGDQAVGSADQTTAKGIRQPDLPSQLTCDGEGLFRKRGLTPGTLLVKAYLGERESDAVMVVIEEGREVEPITLTLREPLRLRGRVVEAGRGLPGARVSAVPVFDGIGSGSVSDQVSGPDGHFEVATTAAASTVILIVSAPGRGARLLSATPGAGEVEVAVDEVEGVLVVEMPPGDGSPQLTDGRVRLPPVMLLHNGFPTSLAALGFLLGRDRVRIAPESITITGLASDHYTVCTREGARAVRRKEDPGDACDSGFLLPYGELALAPGRSQGVAAGRER